MTKGVLTVGLLWHSVSSDNLGVGALTMAQMSIIDRAAAGADRAVRFIVFGWAGAKNYGDGAAIEAVIPVQRNFFLPGRSPFIAGVRRCDVVFDIGEGDSFADLYGLRRFAYLLGTKAIVLALGKPLVMSPQTIGPFKRWLPRSLACAVMRRCLRVYARDGQSLEYLHRLRADANAREATDVAFRLPFARPPRAAFGRPRVGLNVSGLLYNGGYTGDNQFRLNIDYARLVHTLIETLLARGDCEIHLVGHVFSETFAIEDDYRVCEQLCNRYPGLRLAPRFASPAQAKSCIAGFDFFVGARMHACIAAFSAGVPVVPMAYSRKFNGLFQSLGYPYLADCRASPEPAILELILDALGRRDELRLRIEQGNLNAERKLASYERYVTKILRGLRGAD